MKKEDGVYRKLRSEEFSVRALNLETFHPHTHTTPNPTPFIQKDLTEITELAQDRTQSLLGTSIPESCRRVTDGELAHDTAMSQLVIV